MHKNYVSSKNNHVHQDGLHVHGDLKMHNKFAFSTHLSKEMKDFVMEQLKLCLKSWQNIGNV